MMCDDKHPKHRLGQTHDPVICGPVPYHENTNTGVEVHKKHDLRHKHSHVYCTEKSPVSDVCGSPC